MQRYNFHSLIHLPHHQAKGLSPLFVNATLRHLAVSLVGIFVPLYIFKITGSFGYVLAFFGLLSFFALLFDYPGAKLISRLGFRYSVVVGNLLLLLKIVFLVFSAKNTAFLFLVALFGGAATTPYWLSYHTIFSEDGKREAFGTEVGVMGILSRLAAVAGPLLGGLIITFWGFKALYLVALAIIFLSSLPLFFMVHHPRQRAPSPTELFSYLKSGGGRRWFFGFWLRELESDVLGYAWPVFLFLVVGSYEMVGGITSAALSVSLFLLFLGGKLADRLGKVGVLRFGSFGTALAWLLLGLGKSGGQVFILITLLKAVRIFFQVPFDALTYSQASRHGAFGFLVFRELALHSGAILAVALLFLFWYFSLPWWAIFALASFSSFGVGLLISDSGSRVLRRRPKTGLFG